MAELVDVLNDDAFSVTTMTDAINETESAPDRLEKLNLFRPNPVRTESIVIERSEHSLSLVRTSGRGEDPEVRGRDPRNLKRLNSVRLALSNRIKASEFQFIRQLGTTEAIAAVQKEFAKELLILKEDIRATHEHMRLGALQGLLVDADGSVHYDYFDEFKIEENEPIEFDLVSLKDGELKALITQTLVRPMKRAAKGARYSEIRAVCGDNFWDNLIKSPEVRETYKVQMDGHTLRGKGTDFELHYADVIWENYVGTDDNKTVALKPDEVRFFPAGERSNVFEVAWSPGESFDDIGSDGMPFYVMQLMDHDRRFHVDLEIYSYPLFYPRRPKMLFKGVMKNSESTVPVTETTSNSEAITMEGLAAVIREVATFNAPQSAAAITASMDTIDNNVSEADEVADESTEAVTEEAVETDDVVDDENDVIDDLPSDDELLEVDDDIDADEPPTEVEEAPPKPPQTSANSSSRNRSARRNKK